jgi:integrase
VDAVGERPRVGSGIRVSGEQSGAGHQIPTKPVKQKPAITAGADFAKLLGHFGEPYRTMVSLIAATGLRRIGELLALRSSAHDLDAGTLAVRESVSEGTFHPKTARAQRAIPLGPRAVKALAAHRARCVRLEPDARVFGNRSGGPFRESKMLRNVFSTGGRRGRARQGDVAPVSATSTRR